MVMSISCVRNVATVLSSGVMMELSSRYPPVPSGRVTRRAHSRLCFLSSSIFGTLPRN